MTLSTHVPSSGQLPSLQAHRTDLLTEVKIYQAGEERAKATKDTFKNGSQIHAGSKEE